MNARLIFLFILSLLCLSACTSGVLTGAQLFYDREEIKNSLDNFHVSARARRRILPELRKRKDIRLSVTSFNNDLLLTGQVPTKEDKLYYGQLVKGIKGARDFFNQLQVMPKISLMRSLQDTWISTQLMSKFIARNDITHQDFKVVTENGVVYLMGDIKRDEANKAIQIARHTKGVKQVVKVFRYYQYQLSKAVTLKRNLAIT